MEDWTKEDKNVNEGVKNLKAKYLKEEDPSAQRGLIPIARECGGPSRKVVS